MNLQLIKTLCEKRTGGIKKLASVIGMSEQNLHRCIRENKIQAQDLEKIADFLNIQVSDFFEVKPSIVERNELNGSHSFIAKNSHIDNREYSVIKEKAEVKEVTEEIVLPPDCPDEAKLAIEKLKMEISLLYKLLEKTENQLQEKERFINHLLHK